MLALFKSGSPHTHKCWSSNPFSFQNNRLFRAFVRLITRSLAMKIVFQLHWNSFQAFPPVFCLFFSFQMQVPFFPCFPSFLRPSNLTYSRLFSFCGLHFEKPRQKLKFKGPNSVIFREDSQALWPTDRQTVKCARMALEKAFFVFFSFCPRSLQRRLLLPLTQPLVPQLPKSFATHNRSTHLPIVLVWRI